MRTKRMAEKITAFKAPSKSGDVIFSALVKIAALITLLMLGGIIISLIFASWPSMQKFGFSFLWNKEGCASRTVWCISAYLRHHRYIINRSDYRRTSEFWYRIILNRARA